MVRRWPYAREGAVATDEMRTKRLTADDREFARRLFALMAEVFDEDSEQLSDGYLGRLLGRADFWAIAAFVGDDIIGGITAHTLPMTRTESSEIFIYDVAVREDHRRKGVGRQLMTALQEGARAVGIYDLFVPADDDDIHALDFYRALGGIASSVTLFTFSGDG
jgi:aminoglycoside 3-N-acetyltransferase I